MRRVATEFARNVARVALPRSVPGSATRPSAKRTRSGMGCATIVRPRSQPTRSRRVRGVRKRSARTPTRRTGVWNAAEPPSASSGPFGSAPMRGNCVTPCCARSFSRGKGWRTCSAERSPRPAAKRFATSRSIWSPRSHFTGGEKWTRGYNQSGSRRPRTGAWVWKHAAFVPRPAPPGSVDDTTGTTDARGKRRENDEEARFGPSWKVTGKTVLLVDDVMTTGSTLGEAARSARRRGNSPVVWSLRSSPGGRNLPGGAVKQGRGLVTGSSGSHRTRYPTRVDSALVPGRFAAETSGRRV